MTCIIVFSGGLDSSVLLAMAQKSYAHCIAITFDYGQRHHVEIEAAKKIAEYYEIPHHVFSIDTRVFADSSLLKSASSIIPKGRTIEEMNSGEIPSTYVPARNTLFLSYATAVAEVVHAEAIYFGANAADRHCYVDCREEYLQAMQGVINLATTQAVLERPPRLMAPLLFWDKPQIIREGIALEVPFHLTLSCYDPQGQNLHCGLCDACKLRKEGFANACALDPTTYASQPLLMPTFVGA